MFSEDGSTLAIEANNTVDIWDPLHRIKRGALPIDWTTGSESHFSLSDDGKLLADLRRSGDIEIWDVASARKKATLMTRHTIDIDTSVAFSPDDRTLALLAFQSDLTSVLELWDTATGHLRATSIGAHLDVPQYLLGGVWNPKILFSPDGKTVISAMDQGIVDVATGARRVAPNSGLYAARAVSRGGLVAANVGTGQPLTFWDGRTLQQRSYIPNDAQLGDTMAFSPDGQLLAAADENGQIRLWDVTNRHPFGLPLTGPDESLPVEALAFSADGSAVLSIDSEGRLHTHLIGPAQIETALCAQVGPLSPANWKTYIPDLPYRRTC
ncbi:WD domain G-beta repeat uncharacterized protein [Streptomyces sp. 846.5]|nr:hypothetical protein [Streptomyces sp. 846.5]TDU04196.1 WD domain G-beta repeat uncharacterized protein [Streptomyces sp. 846.5]